MYYMEGDPENEVKIFDTDELLSVGNFLPLVKALFFSLADSV